MSSTFVGNLTRDPEVRQTQKGLSVASFSVAVTRKRGDEEYVSYFDCSVWGTMAENVMRSLHKGDRVVVFGTLTQDRFTDKEGKTRSATNLTVEAVGPDLRWATAIVKKNEVNGGSAKADPNGSSTDPF